VNQVLLDRIAQGRDIILIIDEAQNLSFEVLEQIRLLSNLETDKQKLLQIILMGQPELKEVLARKELRQLRQRVAARCRIPLLTLEETEDYLQARLNGAGCANRGIFPAESMEALYSYAQGIPRVTNLIGEKALIAAYAERHTIVSTVNVRHAAAELDLAYEPSLGPIPEASLRPDIVVPMAARAAEPQVVEPHVDDPQPASPFEQVPVHAVVEPSAEPSGPLPAMQLPVSIPDVRTKPNIRVFATKPPAHEPIHVGPAANLSEPTTNLAPNPARRVSRRQSAFHRYWGDVAQSFLRDCRYFLSAFRTQSAVNGKVLFMKKYDLRRDLVAPVSRWLSKPVSLKGSSSRDSDSQRRTGSDHF